VQFIKTAQAIGFTLQEIADLLMLRGSPECTCSAIKARATGKIADIDRRISALAAMRIALVSIAASCDGGSAPLDDCPILSALDAAEGAR
jgi:DNA-binding transcriptional MerR regulator